MDAYEALHRRMVAVHTPEVVDLNLTLAQLKVIYVVAATGSLSMGALAEQLGTALSTTSGTVDRLVRRGLLERMEDPADRRQVIVQATPIALEQIEVMSELGRARMRELLTRLDPSDIATIDRAIRILADAVADLTKETQ
jgi:DNA-binding MarR family transcriptional regulator